MGNLRNKYSDTEWEHLVRMSKLNGGEHDIKKYADVPIEIYDAAVKHATNNGMMSHIWPEKKDNFIVGAMSNAAREYWFSQFKKDIYAANPEILRTKLLLTSHQWQQNHLDIIVLDPDGWDRKNYQYSWCEELITEEEYLNRRLHSTCVSKIK